MPGLSDDDRLARELMFKDQFDGDAVGASALVAFRGNSEADGSFEESLWHLGIANAEEVHAAGCQRARRLVEREARKREKAGLDRAPEPGVDKPYYCGFSQAVAKDLRIEGKSYITEVAHTPEADRPAHVSLSLRPKPGLKLVANDRTEASRALALKFGTPIAHICADVGPEEAHPLRKYGLPCLEVAA